MKKLILSLVVLSASATSAFAFSVSPQEFETLDQTAVMTSSYLQGVAHPQDVQLVTQGYNTDGDALFNVDSGACQMQLAVKHTSLQEGIGNGMVERTVTLVTSSGC